VPAAAVIPAPIAYAKFAAVKKLVVGFLVRCLWVAGRWVGVWVWVSTQLRFTVQRNHPCVPEFRLLRGSRISADHPLREVGDSFSCLRRSRREPEGGRPATFPDQLL